MQNRAKKSLTGRENHPPEEKITHQKRKPLTGRENHSLKERIPHQREGDP
jgi:hypothetical protein